MITIDVESRKLIVPEDDQILGTSGDVNSRHILFQLPRFDLRGNDFADYKSWRINWYNYATKKTGQHIVNNIETTDTYILFQWTVHKETVALPGEVDFLVEAVVTDSKANITKAWHSMAAKGYTHVGIIPDNDLYDLETRDAIETILANVNMRVSEFLTNLENKYRDLMNSLPGDYSESIQRSQEAIDNSNQLRIEFDRLVNFPDEEEPDVNIYEFVETKDLKPVVNKLDNLVAELKTKGIIS